MQTLPTDALMIREAPDGEQWDVKRINRCRIEQFRARGWSLLLDAVDIPQRPIRTSAAADSEAV